MIILRFIFLIFPPSIIADWYSGEYFDVNDPSHADCIPQKYLSSYIYDGDRDETLFNEECVQWKDAIDSFGRQWRALVVDTHHSKCRLRQLPQNYALNPNDKSIVTGQRGPWCYVEHPTIENKYFEENCFKVCDETNITHPMRVKGHKNAYKYQKLNYNRKIIDNIQGLFKKYDDGDLKYYSYRPSLTGSPYYSRLRRTVFYALCLIFVAIVFWVLLCICLKKQADRNYRKRQKALQKFFETAQIGDIRMTIELEREAEI